MPPYVPPSTAAAFVAGLVTSLHCAGMCGPLACAIMPAGPGAGDESTTASAYHVARLAGYTALGAAAGGLGRLPLEWLPPPVLHAVPLLSVVFFLGLAFRWDRKWAKPLGPVRRVFQLSGRLGRRSRWAAAAALGAATPLLPCGALYFYIALALLAGSAAHGAELMLAFGLGTLPLLWVVQTQLGRIQARLSPVWLGRVRLALALLAAAIAAWRARMSFAPMGSAHAWLCF